VHLATTGNSVVIGDIANRHYYVVAGVQWWTQRWCSTARAVLICQTVSVRGALLF